MGLSSTGSELIEMECQQMKSNENEITTHLNGSFSVPLTMTIKTTVISNQDYFDGEWNALCISDLLTDTIPRLRNHNTTDDGNVDFRSFRKILRSRLGKLI